MALKVTIEGYLLTKGKGWRKKWKRRYFEIIEFKFSCFTSEDKKILKDVVNLQEIESFQEDTSKDKDNVFLFSFSASGHSINLQASSKEEREKWMSHITKWAKSGSKGKPPLTSTNTQQTVEKSTQISIPNQPNVELTKLSLTEIPKAIWKVTKIESLIVSENSIITVPPEISELKTLKVLNLSYNKIKTLPDSIVELENLEELNLHSNDLTNLPESIGNLTNLEVLWISQNHINTLPDSLGKLKLLNKLSIAYNEPGLVLPSSLEACKDISWLDISGNKYDKIPDMVFKFVNLHVLEATNNHLIDLPKEIGFLKLLREFRVSHNKIKEIPEEIGNFVQLQELDLSFNNLDDLPKGLANTPAFIQVHSNPLSKIPEDVVENGSGAIKQYLKKL